MIIVSMAVFVRVYWSAGCSSAMFGLHLEGGVPDLELLTKQCAGCGLDIRLIGDQVSGYDGSVPIQCPYVQVVEAAHSV